MPAWKWANVCSANNGRYGIVTTGRLDVAASCHVKKWLEFAVLLDSIQEMSSGDHEEMIAATFYFEMMLRRTTSRRRQLALCRLLPELTRRHWETLTNEDKSPVANEGRCYGKCFLLALRKKWTGWPRGGRLRFVCWVTCRADALQTAHGGTKWLTWVDTQKHIKKIQKIIINKKKIHILNNDRRLDSFTRNQPFKFLSTIVWMCKVQRTFHFFMNIPDHKSIFGGSLLQVGTKLDKNPRWQHSAKSPHEHNTTRLRPYDRRRSCSLQKI